jgi:hypothetical protein
MFSFGVERGMVRKPVYFPPPTGGTEKSRNRKLDEREAGILEDSPPRAGVQRSGSP